MENDNSAILEYLANPYYYNVLLARKKNNLEKNEKNSKEDIRFYRKRIIAFTKEMLKITDDDATDDTSTPSIKKEYNAYIKHMINYFKMVDRVDILQNQYQDSSAQRKEHEERTREELANKKTELELADIARLKINDEIMIKKTIKVSNLNDFVIITKDESKEKENKRHSIPLQKEIDLTSPILKNKGIKKKVRV
jgi:hypothetical protein